MDFLKLKATLGLDSKEYEDGLTKAENTAKGLGSKVGTAFKAVGVGVAAATAATAAVSGAFIKATGKVAEYGDHVDKMSQKMGLSAEKYQEWDAIMQHSGTTIDTMKAGMKTLASAVESGNTAFERIGLTQEQISKMSQEELFEATIAGLQNVGDTTERTYLASQLLGRGATELGALLNTSAEDTEKMRQRVHELGGVMSDESVKAAARYTDSLQDMQTAMEGVKRNIMSSFLPSITTIMDGLANIFSGEKDLGLSQIEEGVTGFIQKMNEGIPKVLEVGASIVGAIGKAIVNNLPSLYENAVGVISNLASGIGSALPDLISKGSEMLQNVAQGIANAMPSFITKFTSIISNIASLIRDNAPTLISAGINILITLGKGLIQAIPTLIANIPQILKAMWDVFTAFQWLSLGRTVITAVGKGIKAVGKNLPNVLKSLGKKAWDAFKNIKWASVGKTALQAIIKGIKTLASGVSSALKTIGNAGMRAFKGINWASLGKSLVQGIIKGIKSMVGAIGSAVANLVKGAFKRGKEAADSHSPSKLFRYGLGVPIGQGVALGVEDTVPMAEQAISDMINAMSAITLPVIPIIDDLSSFSISTTGDARTLQENFILQMGDQISELGDQIREGIVDAVEGLTITLDKRAFGKATRKAVGAI